MVLSYKPNDCSLHIHHLDFLCIPSLESKTSHLITEQRLNTKVIHFVIDDAQKAVSSVAALENAVLLFCHVQVLVRKVTFALIKLTLGTWCSIVGTKTFYAHVNRQSGSSL